MSGLRVRAAVSPLRRRLPDSRGAFAPVQPMPALPTVDELVAALRPEEPVHCIRPGTLAANAAAFVAAFPGDTLYAVKCNPDPAVLRALWRGGVRHFDCASPAEVALVRQMFPDAGIHFMHPVKARGAIREAWARYGVRDFALDSRAELAKLLAETAAAGNAGDLSTGDAGDLGLVVRLALPKGGAVLDLSGKFGAAPAEAAELLRTARPHAARLGIAFHVGSQCLDPLAWRAALRLAAEVVARADVGVDLLDVGGGFPVGYPDTDPPPLGAFLAEIEAGAARPEFAGARLWAEPGRALVAAGGSVVVQVQGRRDGMLFINDGVYGSLADAGPLGFRYPAHCLRASTAPLRAFGFFGPTCDSADVMRGPFLLPDDIGEGDWIEIGLLGAYGACLRTGFNGFDRARIVEVAG
jgi:ornithine decarboxylase